MNIPKQIKRILLTTRLGDISQLVAPFACMIAKTHEAELEVIHVLPTPEPMVTGVEMAALVARGYSDEEIAQMIETGVRKVRTFIETYVVPNGIDATPVCRMGTAWEEIAQHARERATDLIVMGTHGDGMLHRIFFGSVSKAIVEHAPCPVLLLPLHDVRNGDLPSEPLAQGLG